MREIFLLPLRGMCYNNSRIGKRSGSEGDIYFSCGVNEQTSDKIGQEALKARVCESGVQYR